METPSSRLQPRGVPRTSPSKSPRGRDPPAEQDTDTIRRSKGCDQKGAVEVRRCVRGQDERRNYAKCVLGAFDQQEIPRYRRWTQPGPPVY